MTLYSIFDAPKADQAPVAVADRFSWYAALLPPFYALSHRLWLFLLGFVVAVIVIAGASVWLSDEAGLYLYVLLAVWTGFAAPALRRRALTRRRYVYRSERIAPDEDMALVDWLRGRSAS